MSIRQGNKLIANVGGGITDQTYDATSTNAQSGTAVAGLLEAIYPIGSVYIGTQSTCPMSTVMSGTTWTLQSSAIVTSVDTSVPIKGNGKTLTLSDASHTVGFYAASSGSGYLPLLRTALANVDIGTAGSGSGIALKGLGVTTDSSKSGIVGTVTRSTLSVNIWKRTA